MRSIVKIVLLLVWSSAIVVWGKSCPSNKHRRLQEVAGERYHKYKSKFEPIDDFNIHTAVEQWLNNRTGALMQFGPINDWDVSQVTWMRNLFKDATIFNDDISDWDVSCVTNMHGLFWGASSYNQPMDTWNTERVETMYSMFREAVEFNQDLPWSHQPALLDVSLMFEGALSFQGDLRYFDTSSVSTMARMFKDTFYNGDISSWDVKNVFNMQSMFEENMAFNGRIKDWDTKSLSLFERMLYNATSFDQKLCWDLPEQKVKSFAVFCNSNGTFAKDCVDKDVIGNAKKRCTDPLQDYIQSWTDFIQSIIDFFTGIFDFFGQIFDLVCFAPDAMVFVEDDRHVVPMKQLQVGDLVLTGSGEFQPIYSMFHAHKSQPTPYIQIHTSRSEDSSEQSRPLEITANHMIHVVGHDNPVPAWQVEIGDYLYAMEKDQFRDSSSNQTDLNQQLQRPKLAKYYLTQVIKIQEVVRPGLYNPLTPDGTIVVDGILASAYASFLGTRDISLFRSSSSKSALTSLHEIEQIDGWKIMSHQQFTHLLLAPYRTMCLHMPPSVCSPSDEYMHGDEQEFSALYGRIGQHLLVWWLRQHVVAQAIVFFVLATFFGITGLLLSPSGIPTILLVLAAAFCMRLGKTSQGRAY